MVTHISYECRTWSVSAGCVYRQVLDNTFVMATLSTANMSMLY